MPAKTTPASKAIKPTTMRIPPSLLKRCDKVAGKQDRSRSWLINKYIEEGLVRDESPATGAFA